MRRKGETHESEAVRAWVTSDVFFYFPTRRTSRDKLDRLESDAKEGDNVWVC